MTLANLLTQTLHAQGVRGLDNLLTVDITYRQYLLSCKAEDKLPKTIEAYTRSLLMLVQTTGQKPVRAITATDIRLSLLAVKDKNWAPSTVHQYYRSISTFFRWCIREEIIDKNPMQNVRPPVIPKLIKRPFSPRDIEEYQKLIAGDTFLARRNRAIVYLFNDSGVRLAEMVGIKIADIDMNSDTIRVFGKGRKERIVPIGKRTQRALWEYLLCRTDNLPDLWLTEERRPMRRSGMQILIYRLSKRAGVTDAKCGPHTWRHTAAFQCRTNGMSLEEVQQLLGHSSPDTTRRYLGTFDATNQMVIAHRKASPVDHLFKR